MDTSILPHVVQLRNNIDFASISQFLHTFQSAFKPWPSTAHDIISARVLDPNEYVFETEDLERMILEPTERIRLEDMFVRMLRLTTRNRFISVSTWQTYFSKEFDKREFEQPNPFKAEDDQHIDFFTMDLPTQIHLIHILCEWQLDDPERLREHLDSEEDAVQWRVDPIGFDRKGSTFWLFDDNRLYKETPKPKQTAKKVTPKKKTMKKRAVGTRTSTRKTQKSNEKEEEEEEEEEEEWIPWKLICRTKEDWEQISQKYANSQHADEKQFYELLVQDLVPKIVPVLEERERELKKQEAIANRKRSSRIMIKELEALSSVDLDEDQGRRRGSSRLERKQQEKEQKEKENVAKAREERMLERERRLMEREYRAMAREKRQEEEEEEEGEQQNEEERHEGKEEKKVTIATAEIETDKPQEPKPKRKYTRRLDEHGNPLPRKPKLDADGNPIPLKKRGRKPKNKNVDQEEDWQFECICGVSGKNWDDGTPMIACERCGIWQHISCLENTGQIEKRKSFDSISFMCQNCTHLQQTKKQKTEHENHTVSHSISPLVPTQQTHTNDQHVPPQPPLYQNILPTSHQPFIISQPTPTIPPASSASVPHSHHSFDKDIMPS